MLVSAIGLGLVMLRTLIPDYFSIVIGNGLIILGSCFFVRAICAFADQKFPLKSLGILVALYFIFFHIFSDESYFRLRVIVYSITSSVICVFGIYFLEKTEGRFRGKTSFLLISLLGLSAITSLIRGGYHFFDEKSLNLFDGVLLNQIYFLLGLGFPIGWTFGFILMVNRRLLNELESLKNPQSQKNL